MQILFFLLFYPLFILRGKRLILSPPQNVKSFLFLFTFLAATKFITVELRKTSIQGKLGLSFMQRTNGRGVFITYVVSNTKYLLIVNLNKINLFIYLQHTRCAIVCMNQIIDFTIITHDEKQFIRSSSLSAN